MGKCIFNCCTILWKNNNTKWPIIHKKDRNTCIFAMLAFPIDWLRRFKHIILPKEATNMCPIFGNSCFAPFYNVTMSRAAFSAFSRNFGRFQTFRAASM